jgi:MFS family permease
MLTDDAGPVGRKIFYGWWIVLAAGVGLFMGYGPIIVYTFSVFFRSLSQEFNFSRAETSLAFSLSLVVMCGAMPLVGRLVDRFGARKVIVPSVSIFGLCLISFYFISAGLWEFYAIYLLMGVVGGGTAPVPYSRVVSHWFDRRRGLALGLTMVVGGVGSFIMPSLAYALIAAVGWRAAYVLLGLMVIVITIPVVSLFLKETPQMMGLLPDGEMIGPAGAKKQSSQESGMSGREARHTSTFWLMCGTFFLLSTSINGCLIHLVPMLTDRGVSAQSAAFATSILGGATLLGRVGSGYLLDRLFASYVAVCFFGGAALGIFLLWSNAAGGLVFMAAVLIGLGNGAEGDIMAYQTSRYFGLRAFGEVYSYVLAAYTLGGVVGPLLMGVGFDSTGSYRPVLGTFLLATLIGTGIMTRLGPYRVWETAPVPARASSTPGEVTNA